MPAALSEVAHPLGPPTISGSTVTVDLMLNQPTRITHMIMDMSLQNFIADRVFGSPGGVTGGAVVYDEVAANELYLDRDVQRVAPGATFPIVSSSRRTPKVALVEKWGGKVFITDEARDRNDTRLFTNQLRQLTNTVVRKINQRCIEILDASIAASGQTFIGRSWSAVVTGGSSQSANGLWPARDFRHAQTLADVQELGIRYDLWLLNPADYETLVLIYGQYLDQLLGALGLSIYVSNRVVAGTAYVVASGQVGGMRIEKPLGTETIPDREHEQTWVQASVRPVFYVDNPFAAIKVTGIT